jgi:glycosyltransferase involved in cell wall biosynthesis
MITPLDFGEAWNNREHNMLRHLSRSGCHVTLFYKGMNQSKRLADNLRGICSLGIQSREEDGQTVVRVDPPLNYYAGLRAEADARAALSDRGFSLRYMLIRCLSPLRVLRDLFVAPSLVVAALWKVKGKCHVCIGFGPWGALVGLTLKKLGKVRMTIYEDRDYEPGLLPDRLRQSYTAALERLGVRRADLIVSIGHNLAELRRGQSRRDVHIVPTGVDWERFEPARSASGRGQTLVYVGKIVSWCGVELAIRALPKVLERCPDARLLVVGDGLADYCRSLKQLTERLGLARSVTLLGQVPYEKLPGVLADADVGLANFEPVAFRRYAYPLKVIEYMAAGLPVIATADTESARIVSQHRCGLSVPYEPEPLAEAVIKLLSDRALYTQMRENGIQASAGMTWGKLLNTELDLISRRYEELTGKRLATTARSMAGRKSPPSVHRSQTRRC